MRELEGEIPDFCLKYLQDPQIIFKHPLNSSQLIQLFYKFIDVYKKIPNIVNLPKYHPNFNDVLIIGDIHGHFQSMQRIIRPFLEEKVSSILFLGDYVDRGEHSFEVLLFLLMMALAWPKRVLLLKGNHEDYYLNKAFGYYAILLDKLQIFGFEKRERLLDVMEEVYDHLSLLAITRQRSVCVHAGIPKFYHEIGEYRKIPKPHSSIEKMTAGREKEKIYDIYMELRWNDSTEHDLRDPLTQAFHGYFFYSRGDVRKFLELNNMKRIIKSHEARRGGFQNMFQGKLLHIFSSEPYFDRIEKGYTIHEHEDQQIKLCDLDFNVIMDLGKKRVANNIKANKQ